MSRYLISLLKSHALSQRTRHCYLCVSLLDTAAGWIFHSNFRKCLKSWWPLWSPRPKYQQKWLASTTPPRQFWTASVNCKNHKCTNLAKVNCPNPIGKPSAFFGWTKILWNKSSNSPWTSQIYVASMYIYDLWESWASWWFWKGAKELCWSKIPSQ